MGEGVFIMISAEGRHEMYYVVVASGGCYSRSKVARSAGREQLVGRRYRCR